MRAFPSGSRLEVLESIDSTSAEARRRIDAGEGGPLWIVARTQTNGYGRRGRAWEQQVGDFAGTFVFRPTGEKSSYGQLSFVAALAVGDVIAAEISGDDVTLKWPNDILINGAKTAGLLLEYVETPTGPLIMLGIGINIVSKPVNTPYKATRLLGHGASPEIAVEGIAEALDKSFAVYRDIWRRDGFEPIRGAWVERAHGIGKPITVNLPGESKDGVLDGIDPNGALLLRSGGETQIISAGDIFFGAPRD